MLLPQIIVLLLITVISSNQTLSSDQQPSTLSTHSPSNIDVFQVQPSSLIELPQNSSFRHPKLGRSIAQATKKPATSFNYPASSLITIDVSQPPTNSVKPARQAQAPATSLNSTIELLASAAISSSTSVVPTISLNNSTNRIDLSRSLGSTKPASTAKQPTTPILLNGLPSTAQSLPNKPIKFQCRQPEQDCLNGGMCFNSTCFCAPGFTGANCAINVDECRQTKEPCFNNATCIDEVNQFRCECAPGFEGDRCQDAINMCAESPCLNQAKCVNLRTDYLCKCELGWEGRQCEIDIDECAKSPCQNNGTCHDLVNDYRCDCSSAIGFIGKNCDINFDDCAAKPCGPAARDCIDLTGDFRCVCHDGFNGKKCDNDIDECLLSPCENNGTCIERSIDLHKFHDPETGFILKRKIVKQNLTPNMINWDQYNGYSCKCSEEFRGNRCEEKKKCYTKSLLELCNHQQARCIDVGPHSHECLISASFDGSGQNYASYTVVGEFKVGQIYVKFKSLIGGTIISFHTTHLSETTDLHLNSTGLYLSGLSPIRFDDNSSIRFAEFLDGSEHEIQLDLDEPIEIRGFTVARRKQIFDQRQSPFRGCLMHVRLNDRLIPLVDYRSSDSSVSFEFAMNHLNVGHCRACFEDDCLNNGHCSFQEVYDNCTCPDTFTGKFCEIDINECDKNFGSCHNGALCENLHGGHRCICSEGYKGELCENISDFCRAKQPCATGTCKNVNGPNSAGYRCECPSSHIGERCELRRDCLNECHGKHGHCLNNITCACLPGNPDERTMCEFVTRCEQIEGSALCLNGGTCKNLDSGGYQCVCKEPFYGPICEFLKDKPRFNLVLLAAAVCAGLLIITCGLVLLLLVRRVRKARATRGTYSPSTQERFGNSASDLVKPPIPERLI